PVEYVPIISQSMSVLAQQQCQLEEQVFGLNHADVSVLVLQGWRLPEELTEPIRYHHWPQKAPNGKGGLAERSRLLHLAGRVAQMQICPEQQPYLLQEILELT